jgi:uncharacterized protein YkwD
MPFTLPQRRPRPSRIIARTVGLAASMLLAAALIAWSPQVVSGWNQGAGEATLWQLLNGARVNNGMGPLQQHATLVGLARWRSKDMIQRDYFAHEILGSGCQVYCWYDSNGLSYVWAGENIGWNSGLADNQSAVAVHEQFMNSSGHRANVLNAAFTFGGVGAFGADGVKYQGYVQNPRMFTELFLQPPASAPAPPPPAPAPVSQPPPQPAPPAGGGYVPPSDPAYQGSAAPVVAPKRVAQTVSVTTPTRPRTTDAADASPIVLAHSTTAREARARAAADDALGIPRAHPGSSSDAIQASAPSTGSLRVDRAEAADSGFFEAVLGGLFSFLLG